MVWSVYGCFNYVLSHQLVPNFASSIVRVHELHPPARYASSAHAIEVVQRNQFNHRHENAENDESRTENPFTTG